MQTSPNNVVELPSSIEARWKNANAAYDAGDYSPQLLEELLDLVNCGCVQANYLIGSIYEDGSNGVSKNLEYAFFYYQKSVENFGYLAGYLALSRMYYHGRGVTQNFCKAFEYYSHIAQDSGHLVACFMLGRMYQRGEGVEKDVKQAREWYGRAIVQGSVYGMLNLAMLEADEGHWFVSLALRVKAGWTAFRISRKSPGDSRLRGG